MHPRHVCELLKLLSQGVGHEELSESLRGLGAGNLQRLSTGLNLTMLEQAADAIESNSTNNQEEYWQSAVLKTYPWIISQVFSAPCAMFQDKAYVSGKTIDNRNGNVLDFLYQNKLTNNVDLIEIKTPLHRIAWTAVPKQQLFNQSRIERRGNASFKLPPFANERPRATSDG